jgi:hypothetical protein
MVLSGLPFEARIFFEEDQEQNLKCIAKMEYQHKVYSIGFSLDPVEMVKCPSMHVYKAKALRKMLERQWAKITAGTFTVDVETDLQMAIEDAVSELREVTSAV